MLDKLIAAVVQGMSGGAQAAPGGARPAAGGASPLAQILLELLAGGASGAARRPGGDPLGGLLSGLAGASRGGAGGGDPLGALVGAILGGAGGGGIGGLLAQLQGSGLGREADSWVSRGPNLPVGPDRITQAFGRERLETLARQHGMDVDELTAGLSSELPGVVDALTPEGRLPERDELAGLLAGLGGEGRGIP